MRLRQLQGVLAALEQVDVLMARLVRSRELEILDGNDAEDTPLIRHGLLLALRVVEHHLWRPNGFGLLFREDVEIGVPLQVLVNETRVNPGGILVERDVEGFSDLVNL